VRAVLTKPQYRQRAQALRAAFAGYDALNEIAELVEDLAAGGTGASSREDRRRALERSRWMGPKGEMAPDGPSAGPIT
jgi:hypothetical protein